MEKLEGLNSPRDVDVTKTKQFLFLELSTWALILLAIFSCLWRNDCNVLMGLIIIITLNRKFKIDPAMYSKIIIHILVGVIIIDIIWMFIMWSYWNDSTNEKLYTGTANVLHGWVEFLGVLELIIKGAMIQFSFIFNLLSLIFKCNITAYIPFSFNSPVNCKLFFSSTLKFNPVHSHFLVLVFNLPKQTSLL